MNSSLIADLELVCENEKITIKSVELKTFVSGKRPSLIRIGNMNNAETKSTRKDIWIFCMNNKPLFENLVSIKFDKRIHEHLAIKYFYNTLDKYNIRFSMSNHDYALFTLANYVLSDHVGSRSITLYEWMNTQK
jgi:hypothetical protein